MNKGKRRKLTKLQEISRQMKGLEVSMTDILILCNNVSRAVERVENMRLGERQAEIESIVVRHAMNVDVIANNLAGLVVWLNKEMPRGHKILARRRR